MIMKYKSYYILIAFLSLGLCLPILFWDFHGQEDLHTTLFSSFHFRDSFFNGTFPFWNSFLGFGTLHPSSNNLDGHPLALIMSPGNFLVPFYFFYSFHLFVGGVFTFKVCKLLDTHSNAALIGSITFLFCSSTTGLIFVKVVPIQFLVWCLLPLILYLLTLLVINYQEKSKSFLFYFVFLNFIIILLIKWGHVGTIIAYGLAFAMFLLPIIWKVPSIVKPLIFILLVSMVLSLDKAYILLTELLISQENNLEQTRVVAYVPFDFFSFWSLFFKPMVPSISISDFILRNVTFGEATDPILTRVMFIGPPYAFLTLYGIFSKKINFKFKSSFVFVICFSILMILLPAKFHEILILPSANFLYKDTLILFSIIISTITLGSFANIFKKKKYLFFVNISIIQCTTLLLGTLPYIVHGIYFPKESHYKILESTKIISNFIEKNRQQNHSLTAISSYVEKEGPLGIRGWGGEMINSLAIWKTPFLNGYFKFFDMNRVVKNSKMGISQIHGLNSQNISKEMLDVLGIEFIFLSKKDKVPKSLKELKEFKFINEKKDISLYQNNNVWQKINFFEHGFLKKLSNKMKFNCKDIHLFCYDFSDIHSLKLNSLIYKIYSTNLGSYNIQTNLYDIPVS